MIEIISKLEDRSMEIMESEEHRERMKGNEESLREMWDSIKCDHTHVMGVPEGEEKKYLKYYWLKTSQIGFKTTSTS